MNSNNNLNNISILFFAFVAIIIVINLFTTNNYGRANQEVVALFEQEDYMFNYHQLHQYIQGETDNYLFIDLRDAESFDQGHITGSMNIPYPELLERTSLRTIRRSGNIPVLYADKESKAHTARMLLLSKGLDTNIKVMGGSYQKAVQYAIEQFEPAYANYKDEKARFDYRRYMHVDQPAPKEDSPSGIIPAVREETLSGQGGC